MASIKHYFLVILVVLVAAPVLVGCCQLSRFGFSFPSASSNFTEIPDQPRNHFRSSHYRPGQIRKVVMVAPFGSQSSFREQENFAQKFANQLRALGVFDVVINRDFVHCDVKTITTGKFDERIIAELAHRYSADAVLFTQLNAFSAYTPLSTAASFVLVDSRESVVLLAADGTWDATDRTVRADYERFVCLGNRTFERPAFEQSPDEFLTYVATRMAQFVQSVQ